MNTYTKWQLYLLNSIQLQLFISFISLPFLIAWGLPISLMSPISTILFGPLLSFFLFISSLIFFCELLYIPNDIFLWILEKITILWLSCLGFEQRSWLIGFCKPPLLIVLVIPLIALAIIHSKKITCIIKRIVTLAFFLIVTCIALKHFPYTSNTIEKIPCYAGEITLINHHDACIMIDPGYIASRPSYESFIAYTLVPEIIQRTGKLELDHVIIFKCNKRIFDALHFLTTKMTIKNLYLPWWNGRIPSFAWKSYAQLKKTITANNGKIHGISYKKLVYKDETLALFVEPADAKPIAYYDATYTPLKISMNDILT